MATPAIENIINYYNDIEITFIGSIVSIEALKNVELIRPGYAIEYDYFPTSQLKNTLETKWGQMNKKAGIEEGTVKKKFRRV